MTLKNITKKKDNFFSSIRTSFDKHPVIKFISILVVIIIYFIFAAKTNGIKDGFLVSILTWSFFVLCTPIADGGILIDFPVNLITGLKMLYSEIIVWTIAILLNLFMYFNNPLIYSKTILLSLFKHILNSPFPYWIIIIISVLGTFLSIYIADDFVNPKKKKKDKSSFIIKYKIIIFIFLITLIIVLYDFLLNKLGINIPLI